MKVFCTEWDRLYRQNKHMSTWPWSDLISLMLNFARPMDKDYRVIELGCGAGANIPLFQNLGVEYYGVDGSPTVVNRLKKKYPELKDRIIAGDYTQEIPFTCKFDLVIDRASLTCNDSVSIKRCLSLLTPKLKRRGKFIGVDWYSLDHSEYVLGQGTSDRKTKAGFTEGPFAYTGTVHFCGKKDILTYFRAYKILLLQHKMVLTESLQNKAYKFATWNFVAQKL